MKLCLKMRWLMLLLVFQAGDTTALAAHEIDDDSLRVELNPQDYVPLAVGNRWTYEHFYWNNSYGGGGWFYPEDLT